ncbi:hypothetical protein ACFL6Y_00050 [Elusimicrobiota bacterium]
MKPLKLIIISLLISIPAHLCFSQDAKTSIKTGTNIQTAKKKDVKKGKAKRTEAKKVKKEEVKKTKAKKEKKKTAKKAPETKKVELPFWKRFLLKVENTINESRLRRASVSGHRTAVLAVRGAKSEGGKKNIEDKLKWKAREKEETKLDILMQNLKLETDMASAKKMLSDFVFENPEHPYKNDLKEILGNMTPEKEPKKKTKKAQDDEDSSPNDTPKTKNTPKKEKTDKKAPK